MHNVCTKEIKKITLSSNDDKIMQLIDSIKIYYVKKRKLNVTK